jgi:glycosyltransferase involved in cell wall biosynthesis
MSGAGIGFRLGLVVPSLEEGGGVPAVARFVLAVAQKLVVGCNVKLISLATSASDSSSVRIRSPRSWVEGVTVRAGQWQGLPMQHVGAHWAELEFQRYRRRGVLAEVVSDCDVLQVVAGSPAWANAVVGLGKPVALQVATRAVVERRQRDSNPRTPLDYWRRALTSVTDAMDDRALRKVDAIQVENPWMLDYAHALNVGRSVDLRYAPPGVNAQVFSPVRRDGINDRYILCVARLSDPRKKVTLLLNAYAKLPTTLRDSVRLVLAGSSGPPDDFWARADALCLRHRVSYVSRPKLDELVNLYRRATVFALSSDEEGLGVVVLESMACGVPVVATRCGGPDGIIDDGVDGYLVPLDDATAMANRLERLLIDRQANLAMGELARRKIEARYEETVAGAVFVDMWDRLLHKK